MDLCIQYSVKQLFLPRVTIRRNWYEVGLVATVRRVGPITSRHGPSIEGPLGMVCHSSRPTGACFDFSCICIVYMTGQDVEKKPSNVTEHVGPKLPQPGWSLP